MENLIRIAIIVAACACASRQCLAEDVDSVTRSYSHFIVKGGDQTSGTGLPASGSGADVSPFSTAPESSSPGGSGGERPLLPPEPSSNRILVVIGCTTPECLQFEIGFHKLRTKLEGEGWSVGTEPTNQMQVLDIRDPSQADLVDLYLDANDPQELPVIVKLEGGKVVRQIKRGCGTPFDRWSAWWLFTGKRASDDPGTRSRVTAQASGGYPTRGGWWSHSAGNLRRHLHQGQHAGKFDERWLNSLSSAELESLHSDDHEGRVKWQYVRRGNAGSTQRTEMVVPPTRRSVQRSFVCPTCPRG